MLKKKITQSTTPTESAFPFVKKPAKKPAKLRDIIMNKYFAWCVYVSRPNPNRLPEYAFQWCIVPSACSKWANSWLLPDFHQ